ncbi:MAG: hypothetical protein RL497_2816 [Pseudomonadota bacterium]|jgi:hypothetical protein
MLKPEEELLELDEDELLELEELEEFEELLELEEALCDLSTWVPVQAIKDRLVSNKKIGVVRCINEFP